MTNTETKPIDLLTSEEQRDLRNTYDSYVMDVEASFDSAYGPIDYGDIAYAALEATFRGQGVMDAFYDLGATPDLIAWLSGEDMAAAWRPEAR